MNELIIAFGLFLFIEGILYALFPSKMKNMLKKIDTIKSNQLRTAGFIFALIGCLIIISSNNLIALFLGIELSSLSLYSLIALNRTSLISGEAAIKYFVLSIIASALILFGFSYLYGITNSLVINEISTYLLYKG